MSYIVRSTITPPEPHDAPKNIEDKMGSEFGYESGNRNPQIGSQLELTLTDQVSINNSVAFT